MANFEIIIQHPAPTYVRITSSIRTEECLFLDDSYPVQLELNNDLINFGIMRILGYVGAAWKTLHITGANSSDPTLVLKYNGVQITSPIDINITGLAGDAAIPLLTVEASGTSNAKKTHTINVTFAISDINDTKGEFIVSSMQLIGLECDISGPQDANLAITGTGVSDCTGTNRLFKITGEANQSVKYQIATINSGNHGYEAVLKNTDTLATYTPSVASGTGSTVTGTLTLNGIGELNMSYDVCARLSLDPVNDNCVSVLFSLYKDDGKTINTSEKFTTTDCSV